MQKIHRTSGNREEIKTNWQADCEHDRSQATTRVRKRLSTMLQALITKPMASVRVILP